MRCDYFLCMCVRFRFWSCSHKSQGLVSLDLLGCEGVMVELQGV